MLYLRGSYMLQFSLCHTYEDPKIRENYLVLDTQQALLSFRFRNNVVVF